LGSDEGSFLQEYFVYFKKKCRNQSANCLEDAADVLCGVARRQHHGGDSSAVIAVGSE
jgi:hypothetical protein